MLHAAPTSETKTETAQSKTQLIPQSEREQHPRLRHPAGLYSSGGMNSTASGTSSIAQPHPALAGMQSAYGNQAVLRIVRSPQQVMRMTPLRPSQGMMLQRKCACGGSSEAGGECAECKAKREEGHEPASMQAKLQISQPGDQYEQEAEHASDQVMRMAIPEASITPNGNKALVRQVKNTSADSTASAPPIVNEVLSSNGGQPLDEATRAFMEPRFGHDFGGVRVHTDAKAAESARVVNALAYTVGRDVVFGTGQYMPGMSEGRKLMAHELTHVVQQGGGLRNGQSVTRLQRAGIIERMKGWYTQNKQFLKDLGASIKESPQHIVEIFVGEALEAIKQHWLRITLVTGGLLLAQAIIAALAVAPEPLITKVIAAILETVVIAVLGYFAAVETKGAYEEGRNWVALAKQANGDPVVITEASRSFVRMVWHIVMAALAVAGVRARLRGLAGTKGATVEKGGTGAEGGAGAGESSNVKPLSSHPGYRPKFGSSTSGQPSASGQSAPYYGRGSAAPELKQVETPVEAPTPATAPVAAKGTTPATAPRPVQPVPAAAAGVSSATSRRQICGFDWVDRAEGKGNPYQKYHNQFAAAMVSRLKIPANPNKDYRVYKEGKTSTDFDSFDYEKNDYYEFKTRHEYLPDELQRVTWLALSRMVLQATDQVNTMQKCKLIGELIWVFDSDAVANAARPFLKAVGVDAVFPEKWTP